MEIIQSQVLKSTKSVFASNYHSFKYYCHFLLYLANLPRKEALIVYQMGRVGSTTITKSLEALNLDMSVYHVHTLTKDGIDKIEKRSKRNFSHSHQIHKHILHSQYLYRQINKNLENEKWRIVTLVRDPIAKNISSFFNSGLDQLEYDLESKAEYMNVEDLVEELIELFLEKYDHEVPLNWFDCELKRVFGVDIFSSEFSKTKGYKTYTEKNIDVLVLKLENINLIAHDAFEEFLGIKNFMLANANRSVNKKYHAVYKKFLSDIKIPDSYIDKMYESKYVQHFYNKEEISSFEEKWGRALLKK